MAVDMLDRRLPDLQVPSGDAYYDQSQTAFDSEGSSIAWKLALILGIDPIL
jgi:hypothetical protein